MLLSNFPSCSDKHKFEDNNHTSKNDSNTNNSKAKVALVLCWGDGVGEERTPIFRHLHPDRSVDKLIKAVKYMSSAGVMLLVGCQLR